jgi:hypothetical protein
MYERQSVAALPQLAGCRHGDVIAAKAPEYRFYVNGAHTFD